MTTTILRAIAVLDSTTDYAFLVVWGQMGDVHEEFLAFLDVDAFETGAATIDVGRSSITLGNGFFESLQRHYIARTSSGFERRNLGGKRNAAYCLQPASSLRSLRVVPLKEAGRRERR